MHEYLRKLESRQKEQQELLGFKHAFGDSCLNQHSASYCMNLMGYMLGKMTWQGDELVERMLQAMIADRGKGGEGGDGAGGEEEDEKLLVFKDLEGKLWQICPVQGEIEACFDELVDYRGYEAAIDADKGTGAAKFGKREPEEA